MPDTPASGILAADLNDRGQVVGFVQDASARDHAFAWRDGELTNLAPLLHPSAINSRATGNNDRGEVVGFYFDPQSNTFVNILLRRGQGHTHRRPARDVGHGCRRHQSSSAGHRQFVLRGFHLAGFRLGGR